MPRPTHEAGEVAAPAAAAAVIAARPPASGLWILSGFWDFVLFVGTPLLILPLVLLAERIWASSQLYIAVAAFGALGHHLPGWIRAYGDRELFQRFKVRFIVAPIFLIAVCAGFAIVDPDLYAITLIAYVWGVWHGLMQTHGFLRIYDAKVKSFDAVTSRLDQLLCLAWFGFGVIFAPSRVHYILEAFYGLGGPQIPMSWVDAVRVFWAALTAVITLAFLVNLGRQARAGRMPSPVKLLLIATSLGFWMYCTTVVRNLLVGILMFEIFHDVQYLAIVWAYNRRRALGEPQNIGRFTRTLFGTRRALIGLYVGLVLAYGSLYLFNKRIDDWTPVFGGLLTASGLLHFYYDGFIWKVRERSTRRALGIEGGQEVRRRRELVPGIRHALKWSPFVAAVIAIALLYAHPAMNEVQSRITLGREFPDYDLAQMNLAVAMYKNGDLDGAIGANRHTLALDPRDRELRGQATNNLVWALEERAEQYVQAGDVARAQPLLHEARFLEPSLPDLVSNKASELMQKGDLGGATAKYRVALLMAPNHPLIHMNLALALAKGGQVREALFHAREAQRGLPQDVGLARLVQGLEQAGAPTGR